jgi:carbamoyl-phosphate synthase large subunit
MPTPDPAAPSAPPFRTATVAVTGLNATDNPGPGVGVVRALRQDPAFQGRVVGLAYDVLEPGAYAADLADDVYLLPYPSQGVDALEARLRHIHETTPLDAIIPTLDSELDGFLALAPVLRELGIGVVLPSKAALRLRSKVQLAALGEQAGLSVPTTRVISDPADLYRLEDELPFPVFVKGPYYGAAFARDAHEAVVAWHAAAARWGLPVLVQAQVTGEEFNVVAVGDGAGGLVGAVGMRKTLLTDKGKGWAGVTVRDPALMEQTRAFMAASGWRGPCELELMKDGDGDWHLLEVNPRFPAWCALSAGAGLNLPAVVARMALGEPVAPCTDYRAGTMFIRISIDQITTLDDYQALVSLGELHRRPAGQDDE